MLLVLFIGLFIYSKMYICIVYVCCVVKGKELFKRTKLLYGRQQKHFSHVQMSNQESLVSKRRRQNSSIASGDFLQRMTNIGWQGFAAQLHPYQI